jgi:hypothetical protein
MRILILLIALALFAGCTDASASTTPTPDQMNYPPGLRVEPPSRFDASALGAVWVTPELSGNKISIPKDMVEKYWIVDFELDFGGVRVPMMAVKTMEGKINVMPRICVPCRSEGWHLKDDVLTCDACGTTFDAKTGGGIEGACKGYPKALVPYTISDGKIVMEASAIATAYQNTLRPGWP